MEWREAELILDTNTGNFIYGISSAIYEYFK
jgi:hypothetical protein